MHYQKSFGSRWCGFILFLVKKKNIQNFRNKLKIYDIVSEFENLGSQIFIFKEINEYQ